LVDGSYFFCNQQVALTYIRLDDAVELNYGDLVRQYATDAADGAGWALPAWARRKPDPEPSIKRV